MGFNCVSVASIKRHRSEARRRRHRPEGFRLSVTSRCPPVAPVGDGDRPFWSVMVPTHNGDTLLAETLASVLAQDPGPERMQIEVVDDHSTRTNPEAVVRDIAGTRIAYFRQPSNVGHVANFNTCLRHSRGMVVHVLHDDDLVRGGFYRGLERVFQDHPEVGAAFTRHIYADPAGHWRSFSPLERRSAGVLSGWLRVLASGMRLTTPAITIRRSVFEELGGFDPRIRGGEDWEMYVRIATRFPVWFEPEPLAVYRYARPGSLTGDAVGTTRLVEDLLRATDVIEEYLSLYLPEKEASQALGQARRLYGRWSLETVPGLVRARQWPALAAAMRVGLRAGPPARMTAELVDVILRRASRRLLRAQA